jgi:transcriptional regulator with XRE-family HTH domain
MRGAKQDSNLLIGRTYLYQEVGGRIKEVRKMKGITQERLAESVSLTRTSLTNIEKGRQKILLHTFVEIASALQIEPSELLPRTSNMFEKIALELPKTLLREEVEFIARVVNRSNDEHHTSKRDTTKSHSPPKPVRNQRSTG